jgi:hypothetical protein
MGIDVWSAVRRAQRSIHRAHEVEFDLLAPMFEFRGSSACTIVVDVVSVEPGH